MKNIISLCFLSLLMALLAFASSSYLGEFNSESRLILSFCIGVFSFIMVDSVCREDVSILLVIISFYHISMLLFPGILHCAQGWFPFFDASYGEEVILSVSWLMGIYSTGVLGGYIFAGGSGQGIAAQTDLSNDKSNEVLVIALVLFTVAGSVICMAFVGFDVFLLRRADVQLLGTGQTPEFLLLTSVPRAATLCAQLVVADRLVKSRSALMALVFFAMLPLTIIANNPFALPRFQLFGIIFLLIYLSKRVVAVRQKIYFLSVLFAGQFLVFPLVDKIARGEGGSEFIFEPLTYLSQHGDFDGLQSILNTYLMVDSRGLAYGAHLLGAIFTFVPRSLWPDKPYSTGQEAGEAMGFSYTNLSAPLPAEIYVDFGITGILLIPAFLGFAWRRLDRAAQLAVKTESSITTMLFYGGITGYATILCRGALLSVLSPVLLFFGMVAVWSKTER